MTPAPDDQPKIRLAGLEVMRGVASVMVVFHHASNIQAQPRFYGYEVFGGLMHHFNVGVDFFFVLSGFIISWIHWDDLGDLKKLGRYAAKRFLRIYPIYWSVLLPLLAMYFLFPQSGLPSQRDPGNIISSFLLLPYDMAPVLGVAWTLVHEIFFYSLFGVLICLGRKWAWLLVVWALGIVGVQLLIPAPPFPVSFFFSPYNLEFLAGVLVALFLRHYRLPLPWVVLIAGACAFAAMIAVLPQIQDVPLIGRCAFGLASMAIVCGLVEIERRKPLKVPAFLVLVGGASYAIYLIHPIALSAAINLTFKLRQTYLLLAEANVFLVAAMATLVGIAGHLLIEKPLIGGLGRLLLRDKKTV